MQRPIGHNNTITSRASCLQPGASPDSHTTSNVHPHTQMGKVPQAGVMIDHRTSIDDGALTDLHVNPDHRHGHDRSAVTDAGRGADTGTRVNHRSYRQPDRANRRQPLLA
ncbi:hypothetical protein D3C81_2023190 [compost metagenome]